MTSTVSLSNPSEQVLELKVQDVILSHDCSSYLIKVSAFIDDLLEKFYHLPRYYNVTKEEDLVGQLVIGLAPHTSAGVLGRDPRVLRRVGRLRPPVLPCRQAQELRRRRGLRHAPHGRPDQFFTLLPAGPARAAGWTRPWCCPCASIPRRSTKNPTTSTSWPATRWSFTWRRREYQVPQGPGEDHRPGLEAPGQARAVRGLHVHGADERHRRGPDELRL